MPSKAPRGWLETVTKAPVGKRLRISSWSTRTRTLNSFSTSACENGTPGVDAQRECTALTRSIFRNRKMALTSPGLPRKKGAMRHTSS